MCMFLCRSVPFSKDELTAILKFGTDDLFREKDDTRDKELQVWQGLCSLLVVMWTVTGWAVTKCHVNRKWTLTRSCSELRLRTLSRKWEAWPMTFCRSSRSVEQGSVVCKAIAPYHTAPCWRHPAGGKLCH